MKRIVLVTRPEPGLGETMQAVAALGFEPLASPLLHIKPLFPTIPRQVQGVLLTSGQAVEPLAATAPFLFGSPVLAVGDATATRARAAGFTQVDSAAGDAVRLAELVARRLNPELGSLLVACGRGHATKLASSLRHHGFKISRRCVYQSKPVFRLSPDVVGKIAGNRIYAALFFSSATAEIFQRILPSVDRRNLRLIRAIAISPATAKVLSTVEWQAVCSAPQPTATALLSLLNSCR